jgi:hypothetical protein
MSEKYFTIGAPMTELPRPTTGSNYREIESSLSGGGGGGGGSSVGGGGGGGVVVKFHNCSLNANLTNSRDAKETVREEEREREGERD